jgi:hypothetical protein
VTRISTGLGEVPDIAPQPITLWQLCSPHSGAAATCTAETILGVGLQLRLDRAGHLVDMRVAKTLG